jgi:general secretion pathway protein E
MLTNDAMRELIHQSAAEADIRDNALGNGMVSMRDDGQRLVQQGLISQAELIRATRD